MTGMRRNEVLGLKWSDLDFAKKRLAPQPRPRRRRLRGPPDPRKDQDCPPAVALDDTTLDRARGWRAFQAAEFAAVGINNATGGCSPTATVNPSTPTPSTSRSGNRPQRLRPTIRFHDLRHTHGSLLIKTGSPSRSCPNASATPTSRSPLRPTSTSFPACRTTPPPQQPTPRQPATRIQARPRVAARRWNDGENTRRKAA